MSIFHCDISSIVLYRRAIVSYRVHVCPIHKEVPLSKSDLSRIEVIRYILLLVDHPIPTCIAIAYIEN